MDAAGRGRGGRHRAPRGTGRDGTGRGDGPGGGASRLPASLGREMGIPAGTIPPWVWEAGLPFRERRPRGWHRGRGVPSCPRPPRGGQEVGRRPGRWVRLATGSGAIPATGLVLLRSGRKLRAEENPLWREKKKYLKYISKSQEPHGIDGEPQLCPSSHPLPLPSVVVGLFRGGMTLFRSRLGKS